MNELKKEIDKIIPKKGMFKQAGYFLNRLFNKFLFKIEDLSSSINEFKNKYIQEFTYLTNYVNDIYNNYNNLYNNYNNLYTEYYGDLQCIDSTLINLVKSNCIEITFEFNDEPNITRKVLDSYYNNDEDLFIALNGYVIKNTILNDTLNRFKLNKHNTLLIKKENDYYENLFRTRYSNDKYLLYYTTKCDIKLPTNMTILPNYFPYKSYATSINLENIIEIHGNNFNYCKFNSLRLSKNINIIKNYAFCDCTINELIIPKLQPPQVDDAAFGIQKYNNNTYTKGNKLIVPTGATGYEGGAWDILLDPNKCGFTIEYSDELLEEINNN